MDNVRAYQRLHNKGNNHKHEWWGIPERPWIVVSYIDNKIGKCREGTGASLFFYCCLFFRNIRQDSVIDFFVLLTSPLLPTNKRGYH